MDTALPFDRKDLNRINTHLLMAIHAFQHAEIDVIKDHLNISEEEKTDIFNEINALFPRKWKQYFRCYIRHLA